MPRRIGDTQPWNHCLVSRLISGGFKIFVLHKPSRLYILKPEWVEILNARLKKLFFSLTAAGIERGITRRIPP